MSDIEFIGRRLQPCASCVGTGLDDPRDDSDCDACGGTGAPTVDGPEDYAADRERDEQIGVW
ncbi:hypothetical protein [Nocardia vaccinii]|uniref:hypothetical protein n=1 Tax=Nocardia vaccinii TaxID=1822 RepID=UPI0008352C39|nr:hypothetical protein [Nocardia vaccinii]